jgi:hypothetical protein
VPPKGCVDNEVAARRESRLSMAVLQALRLSSAWCKPGQGKAWNGSLGLEN